MSQNEGVEMREELTFFINLDGEIVRCHLIARLIYFIFISDKVCDIVTSPCIKT